MTAPSQSVERRFAATSFWSVVGGVLSRGSSLVAAVLVARVLEPAGYGMFSMVSATCLLVSSFAGLGLGLAVTKHVAQYRSADPARAGAVIRVGLIGTALGGIVSGALSWLLTPWLAADVLSAPELGAALRWLAVWIPLAAIGMTQNGVLTGLEAFRLIAVWSGARGAVGALLAVAGAGSFGMTGAVAGLTLAELGAVTAGHVLIRKESRRRGMDGAGDWLREARAQLGFGLTSVLGSAATVPALWLPRVWLARSHGGFADLGIFDAASRWSLAAALLPAFICQAQLPALTQTIVSDDHLSYRRIKQMTVAVIAGSSILAAVVLCAAPGALLALSGPQYRAGVPVMVVLAISILPMSFNMAVGQLVVSRGLIRVRLAGDWALAATMLASSALLIPRIGALGLALAQALAYTVASTVVGMAEYSRSRGVAG